MTDPINISEEMTKEKLMEVLKEEPYGSIYKDNDVMVAPRYDSICLPSDIMDNYIILNELVKELIKLVVASKTFKRLSGCVLSLSTDKTKLTMTSGKFLYDGLLLNNNADIVYTVPSQNCYLKLVPKFKIANGVTDERFKNPFWGSDSFGESGSDRVVLSSISFIESTSSDFDFQILNGVLKE